MIFFALSKSEKNIAKRTYNVRYVKIALPLAFDKSQLSGRLWSGLWRWAVQMLKKRFY
jgi:hypothetical protein